MAAREEKPIGMAEQQTPDEQPAPDGAPTRSFWRSFVRSRGGMLGLFMAPPSPEHPLGQDDIGRDVLSLVIYGAQISLLVGFSASLIIVLLGVVIGMAAGYARGRTDLVLMRITDAILVIPSLPLMLVVIQAGEYPGHDPGRRKVQSLPVDQGRATSREFNLSERTS